MTSVLFSNAAYKSKLILIVEPGNRAKYVIVGHRAFHTMRFYKLPLKAALRLYMQRDGTVDYCNDRLLQSTPSV